jgi:hypothetical protein
MIPSPFGSVGPSWTGISPGVAWPGLGNAALSESPAVAGQFNQPAFGWPASNGLSMVPGPLATPLVVPGGITAHALLAAIALRRGQPQGPASEQDVEEFIYDAAELLPGAGDVEVRCDGGRISLTGSVPHKRIKRDVGEIAWAIPGIIDVNNAITITARRRSRAVSREGEAQPGAPGRKQS